jgi:hypothetical protein
VKLSLFSFNGFCPRRAGLSFNVFGVYGGKDLVDALSFSNFVFTEGNFSDLKFRFPL